MKWFSRLFGFMAMFGCGTGITTEGDLPSRRGHMPFFSSADKAGWSDYDGSVGVEVDSQDADHVMALARDGELLASVDGGDSWAPVLDNARKHLRIVRICPGSRLRGTICVDARPEPNQAPRLFCSQNGGRKWTSLAAMLEAVEHVSRSDCTQVLVSDTGSTRVFVDTFHNPRQRSTPAGRGSCGAFLPAEARHYSDDGGSSWREVPGGSGWMDGQYGARGQLLVAGAKNAGSDVVAVDWNLEQQTLVAAPLRIRMAQVPSIPGHFIVSASDGGRWYTPDSGRTLRPSPWGSDDIERTARTRLYPATTASVPVVAHVESEGSISRSYDVGETWQTVRLPEPECRLHRDVRDVLWCASATKLFRSRDAGERWTQVLPSVEGRRRAVARSGSGSPGRRYTLTVRTELPELVKESSLIVVARAEDVVPLFQRRPSVLRYRFRIEETLKGPTSLNTVTIDIWTPQPTAGRLTSDDDRPPRDASYVLFLVEGGETGHELADRSWRNAIFPVESPVVEAPNALQHDTPRRNELLRDIRAAMGAG